MKLLQPFRAAGTDTIASFVLGLGWITVSLDVILVHDLKNTETAGGELDVSRMEKQGCNARNDGIWALLTHLS
jgi:hypothetical protein